jgi:predicted nucleic acid-binding protein
LLKAAAGNVMAATMTEFVLDCSTTIAWLLDDEVSESAHAVFDALATTKAWVPMLWRTETANAMRSAFRSGRCTQDIALQKLTDLTVFDIATASDELAHQPAAQILQFAHTHDVSAYDAAYLYIALQKRLPLATLDKNLRRAAASAKIQLL